MSSDLNGSLGIIAGLVGLFWAVFLSFSTVLFGGILIKAIVPLLISLFAITLGILARKGGSRILGLIGVTLGVIGALSHGLDLLRYFL
jgi:hypothetical protein